MALKQGEILNGNNLQVYLGSDETRAATTSGAAGERNPIAFASTCAIDLSTELVDTTNKDDFGWVSYIATQQSVTITTEVMQSNWDNTDIDTGATGDDAGAGSGPKSRPNDRSPRRTTSDLGDYYYNKSLLYLEVGVGNKRWAGPAFLNEFTLSADVNQVATASCTFTSSGQWSYDVDVTA